MAAAQAFTDTYIKVRSSSDDRTITEKDLSTLHSTLMQNVLHGYDVLPSALHLTASTLAMLAPEVAFRSMNLYVLPLGMDHGQPRLGSLDFLNTNKIKTQFALDETQTEMIRTGVSQNNYANAEVPPLDLCVMNPPFVRSVGGNLLFGSYPDERGDLQADLKKQIEMSQISASTTAGLGSVFVALADKRLKRGGRLAFVLPAALVSGEAWGLTRRLIADRYHLEMVISNHDAERPNFSENTDLSEVLFIARKLDAKEKPTTTTFVNLWHNPRSIHEALDVASRIEAVGEPSSVLGQGVTPIRSETQKVGEAISTPCPIAGGNWTGALFAQSDLMRACWSLERGKLRVPGSNAVGNITMCRLAELGDLGYDRRDIHDAFEISKTDWSTYDAFWGHEYKKVKTISQQPTEKLIARTKPAKGRKLKSATAVWEKAGDILLAERLRTNTHRLISVGFSKPVLGGTWWAFNAPDLSADQKKALLLWLNSSLSLLLYYGRRVITEGAWMQMKKPGWAAMPVLDVRALPVLHCSLLAQVYDDVSNKELSSLSLLENDITRQQIDGALARVLHLPDVAVLRQLLAREPGLSGKNLVVKHAPVAYVAPTIEYLEEQISMAI